VIPAAKAELGTLEFVPTFSASLDVHYGFTLTPRGTVKDVWAFANDGPANALGAGAAQAAAASLNGVRASIEAGFELAHEEGFALSVSGTYDGVGDSRYEALGLRFGVRKTW